ncbi:MAG: MBL fold metallo-hydrolase [Candidatus Hecatellaceae archaeon]
MKVTFVGSGGYTVTADRVCPSILVDDKLLLDCGFGCLKNLRTLGLELKRLESLLITHHHADHVGDLIALLWAMAMEGRDAALKILGPQGTAKLTQSLLELMHTPSEYTVLKLDFKELSGGESLNGIKALKTLHRPVNLAYRVERGGRSLCYSGDTAYFKPLASFASGCNLLIHDAVFLNEQKELAAITNHSTAGEAGEIAQEAGVEKLVLFHVLPFNRAFERELVRQAEERFDGEVLLVRDLETIEI